jgi:hypothetical protein
MEAVMYELRLFLLFAAKLFNFLCIGRRDQERKRDTKKYGNSR